PGGAPRGSAGTPASSGTRTPCSTPLRRYVPAGRGRGRTPRPAYPDRTTSGGPPSRTYRTKAARGPPTANPPRPTAHGAATGGATGDPRRAYRGGRVPDLTT